MFASIAAEEYAVRKGESESVSREDVIELIDDDE